MKFDFTPEQILSGQHDYSFPQFRKDLREEMVNFINQRKADESQDNKDKMITHLVNLHFDVYYWSALDNDIKDLVEFFKEQDPAAPLDEDFLNNIQAEGALAIDILKALFKKKFSESVEEGLSEEAAAQALDNYIKECLENEKNEKEKETPTALPGV